MRRLVPIFALAALAVPLIAQASSWRDYASTSLGFAVRYPAQWRYIPTNFKHEAQVLFYKQAKSAAGDRNFTVRVDPFKRLGSVRADAAKMAKLDANFKGAQWSATTVGGRSAMVTLVRPQGEGGAVAADAVYVAESHTHLYEIIYVAYKKPLPAKLSQFPSVYRQILASWKYTKG